MTITVQDARLIANELADVLQERGLAVPAGAPPTSGRVLDAVDVAGLLGRTRDWVYQHAAELGGFRMGDGQRARYGFDQERIEEWKRTNQVAGPVVDAPRVRRRGRARTPAQPDLIDFES